MITRQKKRVLALLLLWFFIAGGTGSQVRASTHRVVRETSLLIPYEDIIRQGYHELGVEQQRMMDTSSLLQKLECWYNTHPMIAFASLIGTTITVKFIDGSYTVIMDVCSDKKNPSVDSSVVFSQEYFSVSSNHTAVVLNADEYLYGHRQCMKIITSLLKKDYTITYLANEAVDLSFVRHNLSRDIVYMNTHAGYFDIDGDHQSDAVVIATGEHWTNDTEQKYSFEYQNKMIVKGMVGDTSFIAFTPAFIDYYYEPEKFPDSLVFMATCYAAYDTSMAQAFLDAGASAYVGWSQDTIFWTNSWASVHALRLFAHGLTVQQVCTLIRSGGFYNWLFHSKLVYFGDGDHQIPR